MSDPGSGPDDAGHPIVIDPTDSTPTGVVTRAGTKRLSNDAVQQTPKKARPSSSKTSNDDGTTLKDADLDNEEEEEIQPVPGSSKSNAAELPKKWKEAIKMASANLDVKIRRTISSEDRSIRLYCGLIPRQASKFYARSNLTDRALSIWIWAVAENFANNLVGKTIELVSVRGRTFLFEALLTRTG